MKHHGGCHCGRIDFEVEGDMDAVMECNCSICSKRGYLLAFVPRDKLRLAPTGPTRPTGLGKSHCNS